MIKKSNLIERKIKAIMKNIKNVLIKFIKDYVDGAHAKGVVLGMSGGKDSFVVAALAKEAVGADNVFGIIMPNGKQKDIDDAIFECEFLKIKYSISNIENLYNETEALTKAALQTKELSKVTTLNIAPRLRMNLLYAAAATLGYLVANTSNLSEKMVGYSTKWGDAVGDFAPLLSLTKTEVQELGIELGLPENLVYKKPADGLTGSTDEEVMGFSYSELDDFIRNGKKAENFEKISKMHKASAHKRNPIKTFECGRKNHFED